MFHLVHLSKAMLLFNPFFKLPRWQGIYFFCPAVVKFVTLYKHFCIVFHHRNLLSAGYLLSLSLFYFMT